MNADERNPELLRQEAHSVAIRSQEPFVAWSELRRWSFGKGPAGTKAAIEAFLEAHGGRPEAAAVIPAISHVAFLLPEPERRELLELANRSFSTLRESHGSAMGRLNPFSRVISSLLPKKETVSPQSARPLRISPDIVMMIENRNLLFQANRGSQVFPPGGRARYSALPAARSMAAGASGGHALVHSLSERLSMHGHEFSHEHQANVPLAAKKRSVQKKTVKRALAGKPARRASARARPRVRALRKPARKKPRRK
jgi:hypothetical protein